MTGMPLSLPNTKRHRRSGLGGDHWLHDRMAEARSVLADVAHHPDTLIILAARVICGHTDDPDEYADANHLRRLLERGPFQTLAALPKGGVA